MRKNDIKDAIDILFTDGPDQFASHCEQTSGHRGLDENGKLTYRYARVLCTDFYIKDRYRKLLISILLGDKFDGTSEELTILFKSGLIDANNRLTQHGYYKAISAMNVNDQIAYLEIPVDNFGPIRHEQGRDKELYARDIYSDCYELVIYDEGGLFETIKNCFIYASRRYFVDYGLNPDLLKKVYHRPFEFQQVVCRGILMGERPVLEKMIRENKRLFEKEDFQKNVNIIKTSILHAIKNIDADVLLSDAKRMPWSCRVRRHECGFSTILEAFQILGEETIRKFAAKLFECPISDNRGWSDLTALHNGRYIPIEVKANDKLSYSQIERFFWLHNNLPEHASQRMSHISLY